MTCTRCRGPRAARLVVVVGEFPMRTKEVALCGGCLAEAGRWLAYHLTLDEAKEFMGRFGQPLPIGAAGSLEEPR